MRLRDGLIVGSEADEAEGSNVEDEHQESYSTQADWGTPHTSNLSGPNPQQKHSASPYISPHEASPSGSVQHQQAEQNYYQSSLQTPWDFILYAPKFSPPEAGPVSSGSRPPSAIMSSYPMETWLASAAKSSNTPAEANVNDLSFGFPPGGNQPDKLKAELHELDKAPRTDTDEEQGNREKRKGVRRRRRVSWSQSPGKETEEHSKRVREIDGFFRGVVDSESDDFLIRPLKRRRLAQWQRSESMSRTRDPHKHHQERKNYLETDEKDEGSTAHESAIDSGSTLIPLISSESGDESLFPLHPSNDKSILEFWHSTVLPCLKSDAYQGLTAAHLFRFGTTEENSIPTVLVSIDDSSRETILRERISALFDKPLRSSLRISFEESSIRRTANEQDPPICKARNASFKAYPTHGASVGIKTRIDSTATLGGYVMVDERPAILTVDHLVPKDLDICDLTHPSEQESEGTIHSRVIQNCLRSMQKCRCKVCNMVLSDHWQPSTSTSTLYKSVDILPDRFCRTTNDFKQLKEHLFCERPIRTFGTMLARSGARSRPSLEHDGDYEAEMDWALFSIDQWPHPLSSHIQSISKGLNFSNVVPGANVRATGRTSGYQTGQINTAMSLIKHGKRFTQEWTIFKNALSSMKEWIEGGIGVDGDSGAWIIDQNTAAIYGMAWGRHRVTTRPICLFSPIKDIIEDIKEKMKVSTVSLPESSPQSLSTVTGKQKEKPAPTPPITPHRQGKDESSYVDLNGLPDTTQERAI